MGSREHVEIKLMEWSELSSDSSAWELGQVWPLRRNGELAGFAIVCPFQKIPQLYHRHWFWFATPTIVGSGWTLVADRPYSSPVLSDDQVFVDHQGNKRRFCPCVMQVSLGRLFWQVPNGD